MKLKKRILAMITMAAVLISVAAAPAKSSAASAAQDYLDNMVAATAAVNSVDMTVDVTWKTKDMGTITFNMASTSINNPMSMKMDMNVDMGVILAAMLGQRVMNMQMYLAPDATGTYYMYMYDGMMWTKDKMDGVTTSTLQMANPTSFDTSLFSKLTVKSESEMVGDKECVVVSAQITGKTIWKTIKAMDKSMAKEFKMLKKCKPITVNYYIEKATNLPVQTTMNMNPFIKSYLKKDKEMKELRKSHKSLSIVMNYGNYNNATQIVVPQEALNASSTSGLY